MTDFSSLVEQMFLPGRIYTLTGAGGKSTAMRVVARALARKGIRARLTTTTRVGMEEFSGFPVVVADTAAQIREACKGPQPVLLIVSAGLPDQGKYQGVNPSFFEEIHPGADVVVLVEGDGSRRRPLKVPTHREPVVPAASCAVLALMGASGFGELIDEQHCYNHEAAFGILPPGSRVFNAAALAVMATHSAGCRKGVMPEMGFHVLLNQGDLVDKRQIGSEVLRILAAAPGIKVSLLSFQQEVVYETSEL
jgi:probable selenium-dependent hydroxylase accessory protein YqeC